MDSQSNHTEKTSSNVRRRLGLLGGFLIFFPAHFPNIWGNLSVYVVSYDYSKHGLLLSGSSWVMSLMFIGLNIGMFFNGYLCCGTKMKIFLAIFIYCAGPFVIHFALIFGEPKLLFFASLLMGLCTGISDSTVMKTLSDIAGGSSGRYISIACSGYSFGPFFINAFAGWYVNPSNLAPDNKVDDILLFSQDDVVDRVPSLFIVLGISYVVCRVIGFALLFQSMICKDASMRRKGRGYSTFSKEDETAEVKTASDVVDQEKIITPEPRQNIESLLRSTDLSSSINTLASINSCDESYAIGKNDTNNGNDCVMNNGDSNMIKKDYSPLEALVYLPFYVLWFAYGANLFPFFLVNNSYKTFGLIWIKDDHFLTRLGSALAITGGLFRIVWGIALDRLSIKTCLIAVHSYVGIVTTLMYFMPPLNKWLYMFVVLLLGCGINAVLPTFITVTLVYLGDKNFFKNLGMMSTSRLVVSFLISPLFEVLSKNFGWFALFGCSASFIVLALIFIVIIAPDIEKKQSI